MHSQHLLRVVYLRWNNGEQTMIVHRTKNMIIGIT